MFFQVIETSSAGNCALLRCGGKNVLIDAGVGIRTVGAYLRKFGMEIGDIDAIFITHEHSDHCKALKSFRGVSGLKVFANRDTRESVIYSYPETRSLAWLEFRNSEPFSFGDMTVSAFGVPHDTNDCVGYSFRFGGEELVWATDFGFPTREVLEAARRASVLVLESNYCPVMLENSSRPYRLKMRISSRNGHLSNADAISVLKTLNPERIRKVFLAHISAECNRCEHIEHLLSSTSELAPILPKIEIIPPRGHCSSAFEF